MNITNENFFQNSLTEKIRKLIPNQDKPIRLAAMIEPKDFCYSIAEIFAGAGLLKRHSGQNYSFNGTIYEPLDINGIKYFIYNTVYQGNIKLSEKECRTIIKEIIMRTPEYTGIPNDERYTLFRNGYVDNQTGQMINYVPDYFPTMYIDAEFMRNQPLFHPTMDKFLDDISGGDSVLIKRHWEVIGYCISSDAMAKRIFTLIGESGDNGKSTYLNFLCSLLSYHGVMQMSVTNLVKGWFSVSELSKKRIEISADEGVLNLNTAQIATLKSISGHDWIASDVKHKQQIRFLSTCKILIASNHNIGVAYTACDPAFARRICSLPFDVKIPKDKQDPYLVQKLEAERDAIATEAFRHYLDLRNRNYVFTGDDIYDNNISFTPDNPQYTAVNDFSNTDCDFSNPTDFTYTDELYQAFRQKYGGTIFRDITAFSQSFHRANTKKITKSKKHTANRNAWGFNGVSLKGVSI